MQKQAKVISVKPDGNFGAGTQFGITYKHLIEFDNGDKGHYNSKKETQDKFIVGQEAIYTIETKTSGERGQYMNTFIKPENTLNKPKDNKDQGIITALSCISSAVKFHENDAHATHENVLESAERFFNYAMSKSTLK